MNRFSATFVLGFLFSFSVFGQTVDYSVLVDDPGQAGCDVPLPGGQPDAVSIDAIVGATVDRNTLQVTGVTVTRCFGGVLGAPETFSGPFPAGLNNGIGGNDVIELGAPLLSMGVASSDLSFQFVSNDAGEGDVTTIEPFSVSFDTRAIPAMGFWAAVLMGLVLLGVGFVAIRRQRTLLGLMLFSISFTVWGMTIVLDGMVDDWNNIAPLTTDPDNDSSNGAVANEIVDVFITQNLDNLELFFRIDVVDLENADPVANDDGGAGFGTDEDTAFTTGNVLANDTDADMDTLTVSAFDTGATVGLVTDNGDGTFEYDPNAQFETLADGANATDTFDYTVDDGNGGMDTATVTIDITGVNDAPIAVDDPIGVGEDDAATDITAMLLANDTDIDNGATLVVDSVDDTGTTGIVTFNAGTVEYDPDGQFEALAGGQTDTDTFTYMVSDGFVATGPATVTVTITGVNDAPVIALPTGIANYDSSGPPVIIDPAATATDIDSADLNGGNLSVDVTGNCDVLDVIGVNNVGGGAGQIGVAGLDVSFEGNLIGTITQTQDCAGTATPALVVNFTTANATPAAAQALLQNITFATTAADNNDRTISATLDDGDGDTSNTPTTTVTLDAAPTATPAPNGGTVSTDQTFTFTFSEAVDITAGAASATCDPVTTTPALPATGITSLDVDPATNWTEGANCTITLLAANITDSDTIDPPDNPVADITVNFDVDTAPMVTAVTPVDTATGMPADINVQVTFNEAVTPAGNWAQLNCTTTGIIGVGSGITASGGPTVFTLNPDADLSPGETCTLTVFAAQVADDDTADPPNNPAADFMSTFSVDAAPSVTSTVPTNGATGVMAGATITVNFSESVDLTAAAVTVDCGAGNIGLTGLPANGVTSVVLTPVAPLPSGTCNAVVVAAEVSDVDTNDPPDNMVADFNFSFSTNAAPIVDLDGPGGGIDFTNLFTEDAGAAVVADTDSTVTDSDVGDMIVSLTITLTNTPDGGLEGLSINGALPGGITATTLTPTLIELTGAGTPANYTTALRQIEYNNTSNNPDMTDRIITVVGNDGSVDSATATTTMSVLAVNDPPTIAPPSYTGNAHLMHTIVDGAGDLLDGATDPEGTAVTVVAETVTSAAAAATGTTADDNNVVISANGSFTYNTVPGFVGNDTFVYQLQDSGTPGVATANITATMTLTDLDGAGGADDLLWFIDEDMTGSSNNLGTQAHPFTSLAAFNAATTGEGDFIFLDDDVNDNGADGFGEYFGGITLLNNQRLIGDGSTSSLAAITGITLGLHNTLDAFSTTQPVITNGGGNGIDVGAGNTIRGLDIGNSSGAGLNGTNVGNLTVSDVTVNNGTGAGVLLIGSGTLDVNLTSLSSGGGTFGVSLFGQTGTFTASGGMITGGTAGAVSIAGSNVNMTYDGVINYAGTGTTVNIASNTGGTIDFNGFITSQSTGTFHIAIDGSNAGVTMNFDGGMDIDAAGASNGIAVSSGTLNITGANNIVETVNGRPLTMNDTTIGAAGVQFLQLNQIGLTPGVGDVPIFLSNISGGNLQVNSALVRGTAVGQGILFANSSASVNFDTVSIDATNDSAVFVQNNTGSFTIAGGTIGFTTNNGAGAAPSVNILQGAGNVTIAAGIFDTAGELIDISARTGGTVDISSTLSSTGTGTGVDIRNNTGGLIMLTGTTQTLNTANNNALDITNNTGATVAVMGGGLDIDTTTGIGFNATGGGTIMVSGGSNFIDTGAATHAMNVNGVNIDAAGMMFESISANGATTAGIALINTGSAGGLSVTGGAGMGNDGSGGTIMNIPSNAILLTNTGGHSFDQMNIGAAGALGNIQDNGIMGTNVNGLTVTRTNFTNVANAAFPDEAAILSVEPRGNWMVSDNVFTRSFDDHVRITNTGTAGTLSFFGNDFNTNNDSTVGNDAVLYVGNNGSNATITSRGNTHDGINGDGVQVGLNGNASAVTNIGGPVAANGNDFITTVPVLGGGVTLSSGGGFSGTQTYDVSSNTFNMLAASNAGQMPNLNLAGTSTGGSSYSGTVNNNVLGTIGMANSAGFAMAVTGNGAGTLGATINNNTVNEYDGDHALNMQARDGSNTINVNASGNSMLRPSGPSADAIGLASGFGAATDTTTACANLQNNTLNVNPEPAGWLSDIFFFVQNNSSINLPGYAGGATDAAAASAFIVGNQADTPSATGFAIAPGALTGVGATCP